MEPKLPVNAVMQPTLTGLSVWLDGAGFALLSSPFFACVYGDHISAAISFDSFKGKKKKRTCVIKPSDCLALPEQLIPP